MVYYEFKQWACRKTLRRRNEDSYKLWQLYPLPQRTAEGDRGIKLMTELRKKLINYEVEKYEGLQKMFGKKARTLNYDPLQTPKKCRLRMNYAKMALRMMEKKLYWKDLLQGQG